MRMPTGRAPLATRSCAASGRVAWARSTRPSTATGDSASRSRPSSDSAPRRSIDSSRSSGHSRTFITRTSCTSTSSSSRRRLRCSSRWSWCRERISSRTSSGSPSRARRTGRPSRAGRARRPSAPPSATAPPPTPEPSLGKSPAHFERLRAALVQLVEGVQALHGAGKLHRDIKPSNVQVTPSGRVVLLDFGVATELPRSPDEAAADDPHIVGTPRYMAPEQGAGEAPTAACDWYSVGVVLYEALVGRPPFAGAGRRRARHEADRSIRSRRASASATCRRSSTRCAARFSAATRARGRPGRRSCAASRRT